MLMICNKCNKNIEVSDETYFLYKRAMNNKSIRCGGRDVIYSGDGAHGKFYRDDADTAS